MVKIDTNTMQTLIWNYSVLGMEDIEINRYNANSRHQYMFELPINKKIAMVIEIGNDPQTVNIIDQFFKFS